MSHPLQRHRPPAVPISPLMIASGRPIPDDIRLVYRRPLTFRHVLHRFSLARLEISSLAARCRLMQPTSIRLVQRISRYSIYCTATSVYTISKRHRSASFFHRENGTDRLDRPRQLPKNEDPAETKINGLLFGKCDSVINEAI